MAKLSSLAFAPFKQEKLSNRYSAVVLSSAFQEWVAEGVFGVAQAVAKKPIAAIEIISFIFCIIASNWGHITGPLPEYYYKNMTFNE